MSLLARALGVILLSVGLNGCGSYTSPTQPDGVGPKYHQNKIDFPPALKGTSQVFSYEDPIVASLGQAVAVDDDGNVSPSKTICGEGTVRGQQHERGSIGVRAGGYYPPPNSSYAELMNMANILPVRGASVEDREKDSPQAVLDFAHAVSDGSLKTTEYAAASFKIESETFDFKGLKNFKTVGECKHSVLEIKMGATIAVAVKVIFKSEGDHDDFISKYPHDFMSFYSNSKIENPEVVKFLRSKQVLIKIVVIQLGGDLEKTKALLAQSECSNEFPNKCRETAQNILADFTNNQLSFPESLEKPNGYLPVRHFLFGTNVEF